MNRLALSIGLLLIAGIVFLLLLWPEHSKRSESNPASTESAADAPVDSPESAPAAAAVPTGKTFEDIYALQGHALRLVKPPFDPSRRAFLTSQRPGWEPILDEGGSMIVSWKEGKPEVFGVLSGNQFGFTPRDLIQRVLGYNGYDIEVDSRLISRPVIGDVVFDATASREQLLGELENMFQQERGVVVSIKEVEEDFPTPVLKGKWHYTPLPEGKSPRQKDAEVVEVYGRALDVPGGAQSSVFDGDANWFSLEVANVLQRVIAIEPTDAPAKIHFHFNYYGDGSVENQKQSRDPDLLLQHVCDQTGLTRVTEIRKRKRLVFREPTPAEQILP